MAKVTDLKPLYREAISRGIFRNEVIKNYFIGKVVIDEDIKANKMIRFRPVPSLFSKEALKFIIKEIEKAEKEYLK